MLVVCVGTATEVGKTWVGAAVLAELRDRGFTVAARKPAQSFDPADDQPRDAEVLGVATGETAETVCPLSYTYDVPMAPPMAADVLGRPAPTLRGLLEAISWPTPAPDVAWVESVGGPRSPLASDGDSVDLVAALAPREVVLVADAGLGTLNAVRLSLDAFRDCSYEPIVLLNRFDPSEDLHQRNASWLQARGVEALLTPVALVDVLVHAI